MPDWIYAVIDYVEERLDKSINIENLSEICGYSPRHFQRLFRERTAQSIMEYIRGRRLSLAMTDLMATDKSILHIALEYQFESQQSFTRAFQARFVFPPKKFRNDKVNNPPSIQHRFDQSYLAFIESKPIDLEPRYVELDESHYLGLQTKVPMKNYDSDDSMADAIDLVSEFQKRSNEISTELKTAREDGQLTVSHRTSQTDRANDDGLIVLLGTQVRFKCKAPDSMFFFTADAAKYAVFKYRGAMANYWLAVSYIASCWLPRSQFWIGKAPALQYIQRNLHDPQLCEILFYIPLRSRHPKFINQWW